ncbi:unnamed protein product, partial [Brassica rapa subsp. trilocularis]
IDKAHTAGSPVKSGVNRGKSAIEPLGSSQQNKRVDVNVTYRNSSGTQSGGSTVDAGKIEDLIPPYDALKIDALNEHEPDEDDQAGDAEMQDVPIGNELMIMEEDDLLEEELNQIEIQERIEQKHIEPDRLILMIEAKDKQTDEDNEDYAKELTRTVTRSLLTSQAA